MSEYTDPNQTQDFSQGYTDQGGGFGDFSAGYDFAAGYDTPAPAEEVVYGDEGPLAGASGDEAYAQTYEADAAPGHGADEAAYDPQAAYAQEGYDQAAYTEEAAYDPQAAYGQEAAYDPQGSYDQGYATDYGQGYEQGYDPEADPAAAYIDDEDGQLAAEDEEAPSPGGKRKLMMAAAAGFAVLVGLGGAGYYMMSQNAEGGEGGGGFDIGSITKMIPFLGPKDSEENVLTLQDNATLVKKAVDAYAREQGQLPPTGAAVSAQLRKMKSELKNPYSAEEPVQVVMGDAPTAPGAVAYALQGKGYKVVVGDVSGQPLTIEGAPFELSGRVGKLKPVKQAAAGKPAKPVQAAAKPGRAAAHVAAAQAAAESGDSAETPEAPAQAEPMARPRAGKAPAKPDQLDSFIAERTSATHGNGSVGKVLPTHMVVLRNQEFDRWRSRGITLVYEQRTAESIAAFKRALSLRPGDPSVTRWLATIQGVIDKHTFEERDRYEKEKAAALQKTDAPPVPIRAGGPPLPAGLPGAAPEARSDDAMKMYKELQKQDKVPLLAPPKLDD